MPSISSKTVFEIEIKNTPATPKPLASHGAQYSAVPPIFSDPSVTLRLSPFREHPSDSNKRRRKR